MLSLTGLYFQIRITRDEYMNEKERQTRHGLWE